MKKFITALFFVVCILALGVALYYYLSARASQAEASRPIATRRLTVEPSGAAAENASGDEESEPTLNRIGTLPNEVVLDVLSLNLDTDEGEEQILTVRKTDRPEGTLFLVVADYLPDRRAWVRSWEGELPVTKLTTLQVQTKDLVGDHTLCILAWGMNDANEQTLSVFGRDDDEEREALSYRPIATLSADSIEVEETERSEGYQLGQTKGESYRIVTYHRDKESSNLLDQIKTFYVWDGEKGGYAEAGSEKIPGALVEKEMASQVLTGKEEDFEAFLDGVWYDTAVGPSDEKARLIVFDRASGSITFYSAEAQEVFQWTESHSTRYGLYIGSQNESVTNLRRLMDIELTGAESISIRIFEDLRMKIDAEDRWDGNYRKLAAGAAPPSARHNPPFHLEGSFGNGDTTLQFGDRRYTLNEGGKSEHGGFVLYSLGEDTVLELVALKENGLVASRKSYRVTYTETKKGKAVELRLRLSPALISITGLELKEEDDLVLEQKVDGQ